MREIRPLHPALNQVIDSLSLSNVDVYLDTFRNLGGVVRLCTREHVDLKSPAALALLNAETLDFPIDQRSLLEDVYAVFIQLQAEWADPHALSVELLSFLTMLGSKRLQLLDLQ